eukprot:CAMPEP_0116869046 /NCGR_PEP_ID=MMETSP0418-20121206/27541_1 /TAXON_ID=1158023 /ORGANISM="Astrosyne radiata, Strain 13vi08-1A" /LENGTH=222 /DNA_ID=CAMNT_0004505097 /DNA_START=351 /DNA_END=1019 /DNA_ORIENTATION=-
MRWTQGTIAVAVAFILQYGFTSTGADAFVTPSQYPLLNPTATRTFPTRPEGEHRVTELSGFFRDILEAVQTIPPDFDLKFGMFAVFAAITPYSLGIFFPKFFLSQFFVNIYREEVQDSPEVRDAEIYWKLLFATQALAQTSLLFLEALNHRSSIEALRDSYVFWAIFYIVATIKVFIEANPPRNYIKNSASIQAWHIIVTVVLLADVLIRPEVIEAAKSRLN